MTDDLSTSRDGSATLRATLMWTEKIFTNLHLDTEFDQLPLIVLNFCKKFMRDLPVGEELSSRPELQAYVELKQNSCFILHAKVCSIKSLLHRSNSDINSLVRLCCFFILDVQRLMKVFVRWTNITCIAMHHFDGCVKPFWVPRLAVLALVV